MADLPQVDHDHNRSENTAYHHERLADPEPVRQHANANQRNDVEAPFPVAETVGVLESNAEHSSHEDHEEADCGVVDQEHHGDRDRRHDNVCLQQLPPRVLQRLLNVDPLGPRFDQRTVPHRHHELVTKLRRQLPQAEERDRENEQTYDAADFVLVRPEPRRGDYGRDGVGADDRDDQAAQDRAAGPEPHGRGTADLWGEVTDQRRGRHQANAFDDADNKALDRVGPLVRRGRDDEANEHAGEEQTEDHEVCPAVAVGEPGEQRAEGADQVTEGKRQHEEREGHVQVGQDQRGYRPAHIQLVVEHDGGEDCERQVEHSGSGVWIGIQLPVNQRGGESPLPGDWFRRGSCHTVLLAVTGCCAWVNYMPTRRYPHHRYEINGLLSQLGHGSGGQDFAAASSFGYLTARHYSASETRDVRFAKRNTGELAGRAMAQEADVTRDGHSAGLRFTMWPGLLAAHRRSDCSRTRLTERWCSLHTKGPPGALARRSFAAY